MKTKRRIMVVAGAFLAMALIATGFAFAGKPNALRGTPTARMHAAQSSAVDVAAKDGDAEAKDEQDADEDANLTAEITPEQAESAALSVHPGTATKVELENEDGKAVYGVCIDAEDGNKYDVKVDANSGEVLKSESADEDDDTNEGSQANHETETDAD